MSRREYMYWQNRKDRVSEYICVRASGASERFKKNSFTVKKVNFYTINVKFNVILSSKSGGGGNICTGHPPTQKSGGGGGGIHPPPPNPPGIYPMVFGWILVYAYQCCVTRVGTRTRVFFFYDSDSSPFFYFFTLTRTRTQKSWLGPSHARVQAVEDSSKVLVIYWNKWGREKYLVCFHVLEDKEISNMWTSGHVT